MLAKTTSYVSRLEDDVTFNILLALATALIMLQMLSLYTTPVPDSYLWWGDESWLMIEFRTQILEGVFRHPYALGSSLEHGSGLLFGNMWVTALFYGLPAALLKNGPDIILIGRTVTALLDLTLLAAIFEIIRRLTSDRSIAMLGVILLLTSRSFLLTSHSARYDILSALAIVGGLYYLLRKQEARPDWKITLEGFVTAATLLVTVHVPIALWLAGLISVLFRAKNKRALTIALWLVGS